MLRGNAPGDEGRHLQGHKVRGAVAQPQAKAVQPPILLLLLLLRLGRAPSTVRGENEVSHNGGAVKGQRGKGKGERALGAMA